MATKKLEENPGKGPDQSALENLRVSINAIHSKPVAGVKTDGTKVRGTGAATRGKTARGPMA